MAGGLLDFLGRAATAGVGAESARLEGQMLGQDREQKNLLVRLKQEQDAAEQARQERLATAQIGNYESQIAERERPAPESFTGAPFEGLGESGPGLFLRGSQGTVRPIDGVKPLPKVNTAASRIDPLSPEGIEAAAERARQMSTIAPPKASLPTQAERKAAAFYASGKQGYDTLERLLGGDDPATPQVETGKGKEVPGFFAQQAAKIGLGAGNMMTNQQVRQMRQAALMLSDAWLRYTSGAAVPEQEVERFAESFIPRAGDDPGTLAQKAEARKVIIEAIRKGAGRALDESVQGTSPGIDDLDGQIDAVLGGRP